MYVNVYLNNETKINTYNKQITPVNLVKGNSTHRAVLALHTGAVEAQGCDSVADPLDMEHTLVASLARLGLGQVLGLKGDRLHLPRRDEYLLRAHKLGTVLEKR